MKVLILGATGSVGRHLVEQGPRRGHQTTALVRNPQQSASLRGRVNVVEGDALDHSGVERAVAGQEGVLYALAVKSPGNTTFFSDSTQILIDAMVRNGVRRLVALTGVGAGDTKGHGGFLYDHVFFPLFTKRVYQDKDRQEELIRRSPLEWVIVRPAVFREGKPKSDFQAVTNLDGVTLRRIPRAEVAGFMLDQLTDDRFLGQAPFIGYAA